MKLTFDKIRHFVRKKLEIPRNLKDLGLLKKAGVSEQLMPAFRFLATGMISDQTDRERINKVESIREQLADESGDVNIFYSPRPESAGLEYTADIRPEPGEVKKFPLRNIANQTSIAKSWGIFLYLLAKHSGSKHILELGSCAGISGCYLSSPETVAQFYTIEASKDLAVLARRNLEMINSRSAVINDLFDNALDTLEPKLKKGLDMVWIDGHHEKVATLHYFQRIIPFLNKNAIVLFDDIYWSRDMHEAWMVLAAWKGFEVTIDLKRKKGMGIWNGDPEIQPAQLEFNVHNQKREYNQPEGWK